jgi:succinylglutamate desuccinylase
MHIVVRWLGRCGGGLPQGAQEDQQQSAATLHRCIPHIFIVDSSTHDAWRSDFHYSMVEEFRRSRIVLPSGPRNEPETVHE